MKLTVAAQGGLCNRLRVLLSTLAFAEREQVPTRLVWHPDWQCEAYFDELFAPIESPWLRIVEGSFLDLPSSHKVLYLPQLLRLPFYSRQIKLYHPERHGALSEVMKKAGKLYLNTGFQVGAYDAAVIARLQPTEELQSRIDQAISRFPRETIGVHIRRTDNNWSKEVSTDEAFERAMEAYPQACFYIASDDEEVKWKIRERFKGRTQAQETDGLRNNAFSVGDAVVDLFALAHTQRVIGSYWSSFSDMAAEIGGIPLEIAGAPTTS